MVDGQTERQQSFKDTPRDITPDIPKEVPCLAQVGQPTLFFPEHERADNS
jgi:hypothetical protein